MKHQIIVRYSNRADRSLPLTMHLRKCIAAALEAEHVNVPCEINVLVTDDAGIRITGENHVTIAPKPGGDITFARASYWSICGNVTTSWERTENGYRLTVGIPANTTAEILLPDGTGRTVGAGQHRYEWK